MSSGQIENLRISDFTLSTPIGLGVTENLSNIRNGHTGLKPCDFFDISDLKTWIGKIAGIESVTLPEHVRKFDCRNNRLACYALQQDNFEKSVFDAVQKYGKSRVGVFLGTSTSGIHETERAYIEWQGPGSSLPDWYNYQTTHNMYSTADFVCRYFDVDGVSTAISTACSSSAKAFISAHRAIQLGFCDAAIVGGVDSLCLTTLYGFNALQVVDENICKPSDRDRLGINIGEAAGFALVENRLFSQGNFELKGYGESSDAYHMSTPHPDGQGAALAMSAALKQAKLSADAIDYVNLHGTGTKANDLAEANGILNVLGDRVPASSTKGWTGHTLGAAGIVEAIISLLCLQENWIPESLNTKNKDESIKINVQLSGVEKSLNHVITNSFGFGGSNCSLIMGKA